MEPTRNNEPMFYDRVRNSWVVTEDGVIKYEVESPITAEHLRFKIIQRERSMKQNIEQINSDVLLP